MSITKAIRVKSSVKWNYIDEVGLPPAVEYDWVLVKTDLFDGTSLPHIAELRNGKWWAMNIDLGPMEEVLDVKVIAWAAMELIEDPRQTDEPRREKIRVKYAKLFVGGPAEKPYYQIEYHDLSDNKIHVGYGSYNVDFLLQWLATEFEFVIQ